MAERRRRNLVTTPAFTGCRCCYDPNSDGGGEYRALIELREQRGTVPAGEEAEPEKKKQSSPVWDRDDDEDEEGDGEDDDTDDEFDYLLDEDLPADPAIQILEDQRRAELEMAMLHREVALQHGYGTHRGLHPARVLKAAGLGNRAARDPPPAVVLHLVDPDSMASASLDLCLEELATDCKGTIFCRSGGRSTLLMDPDICNKAFPQLQPDRDMPALVAIKDGVVVNTCPGLKSLCHSDGQVEPRAVRDWLDRSGVLILPVPRYENLCFIRPEEDALMDYLATAKPAVEERYDCGLDGCNKTFPHEHVGVRTSEQDGLVVSESEVVGEGQGL